VLAAETVLLELVLLAQVVSSWLPALAFASRALQTASPAAAQTTTFALAAVLATSFREHHAGNATRSVSLALAAPMLALLVSLVDFSVVELTDVNLAQEIA
jgi:hypothetical protein